MNLERPIVALDIETTGLDYESDSIIEIGLIRRDLDGSKTLISQFVKPPEKLPLNITRITGITDEMLEKSPSMDEVIESIYPLLTRGNPVIIGHNVTFDLGFIHQAIRRDAILHSKVPDNDFICTQTLAWYTIPDAPNLKLATVCEIFEIKRSRNHRAYADAIACEKAFNIMLPEMLKDYGKIPYNEMLYWEGREGYETERTIRVDRNGTRRKD